MAIMYLRQVLETVVQVMCVYIMCTSWIQFTQFSSYVRCPNDNHW